MAWMRGAWHWMRGLQSCARRSHANYRGCSCSASWAGVGGWPTMGQSGDCLPPCSSSASDGLAPNRLQGLSPEQLSRGGGRSIKATVSTWEKLPAVFCFFCPLTPTLPAQHHCLL